MAGMGHKTLSQLTWADIARLSKHFGIRIERINQGKPIQLQPTDEQKVLH
jgi:hypothetical protein